MNSQIHTLPTEYSDERLLSAIKQGDIAALGQLYDLYAPHVLGVILSMGVSRPRGEAILVDVFFDVWEYGKAPTYKNINTALWLCALARKHVLAQRFTL